MNSPFRFVHTADLHLDSPLKSLARRDASLAEHVTNATREALKRTINLCIEEQVHALLIAGDIYDRHNPSVATVGFFLRQLNRLQEHGIRVYMIRGNHDHYSKLSTTLPLPDHVTEFKGKKTSDTLKEHGVVIHGVSFKHEHATQSALRDFKAPDESFKNIALLHTSLGGSEGHDIYAPCSVTDLDSMGFDYWALGHIHKRRVAGEANTIVMPGTPQGRDMGEDGTKTVSLVSLNEDGHEHSCTIDERIVSPVQFERITITLSSNPEHSSTPQTILNRLTEAFIDQTNALKNESIDIDRWIIRVLCKADAATLYNLRSDLNHTDDTLRLSAETLLNVHIDKIQFENIDNTTEQTTTDHSLLKQLKQVVIEHLDDEQLMALTNAEFDDLIKLMPNKETRDKLQGTEELRQHTIETLQKEGVEELLSMIQIDRATDN